MVVIAGYREQEFYLKKLKEIQNTLKQHFIQQWGVLQGQLDEFLDICSGLLYNFFLKIEDLLGLHGDEHYRTQYPKIPFTFFQLPQKFTLVYIIILQVLISNLNYPYTPDRIMKWPDQRIIDVYDQMLKLLQKNNVILHKVFIDPKMPEFIQDLVFLALKKLQFVEIIQGYELQYPADEYLAPTTQFQENILLTAPYDQTLQNNIYLNYQQKRSQQDNINIIKTHFLVKEILEKELLVHIHRTPSSMDSHCSKRKTEEFRKSEGNECLQLLTGNVIVSKQHLQKVLFVNYIYILDSAYYNEYSNIFDYGLIEMKTHEKLLNKQKESVAKYQELIQQLNFQYKDFKTKQHIALLKNWEQKDIQNQYWLYKAKQVELSFNFNKQKVTHTVNINYEQNIEHQKFLQSIIQQQKNYFSLSDQLKQYRLYKTNILSDEQIQQYKQNMHEWVYNQYYDEQIEQLIQQKIKEYRLEHIYNKTIVSVKGQKVDIQEYLKKDSDKQNSNSFVNDQAPQIIVEPDNINSPDEQQFKLMLETRYHIDNKFYHMIRCEVLEIKKKLQGFITPLHIQSILPLPYQVVQQFIDVLKINENQNDMQDSRLYFIQNFCPEVTQQRTQKTKFIVDENNLDLNQDEYLQCLKKLSSINLNQEKLKNIIQQDEKLSLEFLLSQQAIEQVEKKYEEHTIK